MTDPAEVLAAPPAEGTDRRIDLDAARKARREQQGTPPEIILAGETFPLPHELPAEVLDLIDGIGSGDYGAVNGAMRLLLGGEVYENVKARAIELGDPLMLDDVVFLLERALEIYEVTLPESVASPAPS